MSRPPGVSVEWIWAVLSATDGPVARHQSSIGMNWTLLNFFGYFIVVVHCLPTGTIYLLCNWSFLGKKRQQTDMNLLL